MRTRTSAIAAALSAAAVVTGVLAGGIGQAATLDQQTPQLHQRAGHPAAGAAQHVHGRPDGPAGPRSGSRAEKVERVVRAARSQIGKGYDYSWGAGGKGGAAYGSQHHKREGGDDWDRLGYDCSGLTEYAFWKGAGIDIGSATPQQYQHGQKVAPSKAERGDLIFFGRGDNAQSTYHVLLYLGHGKAIEAAPPRNGKSVHEVNLYGKDRWAAHVVRAIR